MNAVLLIVVSFMAPIFADSVVSNLKCPSNEHETSIHARDNRSHLIYESFCYKKCNQRGGRNYLLHLRLSREKSLLLSQMLRKNVTSSDLNVCRCFLHWRGDNCGQCAGQLDSHGRCWPKQMLRICNYGYELRHGKCEKSCVHGIKFHSHCQCLSHWVGERCDECPSGQISLGECKNEKSFWGKYKIIAAVTALLVLHADLLIGLLSVAVANILLITIFRYMMRRRARNRSCVINVPSGRNSGSRAVPNGRVTTHVRYSRTVAYPPPPGFVMTDAEVRFQDPPPNYEETVRLDATFEEAPPSYDEVIMRF